MDVVEQVPRRLTFTDLQQMPDDGRRYELYDGEVWELPSPTLTHQTVVFNTATLLHEYADRSGGMMVLAPFDIVFSEHNVVQPDVVFFVNGRKHLLQPETSTRFRPDVAVEILSPGTEQNDRGRKLRMFARYEVPEYWIVDAAARTLEVFSLRGHFYETTVVARDGDTATSPFLLGLTFPVARLFERC